MRKLIAASVLALGTLCAVPAWAAPAFIQGAHSVITNGGATVSGNAVGSAAIGAGHDVVGLVQWYQNTGTNCTDLTSIVDDQANAYTVINCTTDATNKDSFATFKLISVPSNSPTYIKANFGLAVGYSEVTWLEFSGVGVVDVAANSSNQSIGPGTNLIKTPAVTTTVDGDMVVGFVFEAAGANNGGVTAGTGYTQGPTDQTITANGTWEIVTDYAIQGTHGAGTQAPFSSPVSDVYELATVTLKSVAIPTAISCSPLPSLPDSSTVNTTVCPFTVTMSDGSGYVGTATVAPTNLFKVQGANNSNIQLAKTLGGCCDGSNNFTISATENGVTKTQMFTLNVTQATQPGTPFTYGWKNVDPGAANDGGVIVSMPHTGTVTEVAMRVVTPAAGLVDVYKAPTGTACGASGSTIIHQGDFNANWVADQVQTLPLNGTPTLAIGDSLCVLTQSGFSPTGQATITVTVQ